MKSEKKNWWCWEDRKVLVFLLVEITVLFILMFVFTLNFMTEHIKYVAETPASEQVPNVPENAPKVLWKLK